MGHAWFQHPRFKPLIVCKHCGAVKNEKGNSPCPGKVRAALRENRTKPSAPPRDGVD